jgi:hypothetical protein
MGFAFEDGFRGRYRAGAGTTGIHFKAQKATCRPFGEDGRLEVDLGNATYSTATLSLRRITALLSLDHILKILCFSSSKAQMHRAIA